MRVPSFKHHSVLFIPVFLLIFGCFAPGMPGSAQELTPEMLEEASRRTGMSKDELMRRYGGQAGAVSIPDTFASNQPGLTSLDGIDDSRFRDTNETVNLPYAQALQQELLAALEDSLAMETVPGDTVGFFGCDFFHHGAGAFTPPSFGPVSADYLVGVGDQIVINVWGGVAFRESRIVDRDGTIILPRAGKIMCAGRTLAQVDNDIRSVLAQTHSSIDSDGAGPDEGDTHLEVTLGQLRTIRVFVVGAVHQPGSYEVSSVSRVLTALFAAGGPTMDGSFRDIRLVRDDGIEAQVDLYGYLLGGSRRGDKQLQEGDTIFVPDVGPAVKVHGQVKRPMYYEMKEGETLADLLQYCGGFKAGAASEVIHIQRILPPAQRKAGSADHVYLDVPFDGAKMSEVNGPMTMLDGDVVHVDTISDRVFNFVEIVGQVKRPGRYQFRTGMTVSDLVEAADGVWPDALMERAAIDRTSPQGDLSSFDFLLQGALNGQAPGVVLQPQDKLHIFSRWELQERPQVYITGEVYLPFNEDFREGMTLRDMILKAGGLKRNADLLRAEISRLNTESLRSRDLESRPTQTVETIQVEVNGDFLTREESVELQPWDRIVIRSLPWWENQQTVRVRGEVFYPGTFSLERNDERLSSIISRAGGIKPDAYLIGARVVRSEDEVGNIAIDLLKALMEPGSEHDIILQQGDQIIIPDQMFTVKVIGEVGFPTSLVHQDGLNINDYVDMAGGYLEKADKGKSRVVWPNGMSLPNKGGSKVVAGSTIIVPVEPPPEGKGTWETIRDISSIVASLATVWLIVDK